MKYFNHILVCLVLMLPFATLSKNDIVFARIESCRGCSLNRLPEVKKFILEDVPEYERVDVTYISGAPPELVLLDVADSEVERLPLSLLNREQCNELLQNKGFSKAIKNSEF